MHAHITKGNGTTSRRYVYILYTYRKKGGKTSTKIYKKLGNLNDLLEIYKTEENVKKWADEEALKETQKAKDNGKPIILTLSQEDRIELNKQRKFNVGYLFLQDLCTKLKIKEICRTIKNKHQFKFDINKIFQDLLFSRILNPASKFASYQFSKTLLEQPKYELHDLYRALSILGDELDFIQTKLYENSNFIKSRKKEILYYDCTNYYFEIEQEDSLRKYGKSKEHRPNPIVTLGLFMDGDGLPLAFDLFAGNLNEQRTLKTFEQKIINNFDYDEVIFCSDAGLGSKTNREFNSKNNRHFVITHSLKKLKKEDREIAMSSANFRAIGSNCFFDLNSIDFSKEENYDKTFYKLVPIKNGKKEETLIVTFNYKYKIYQQSIRAQQIDRALKVLKNGSISNSRKNPNDPKRFLKETALTKNGEVCDKKSYSINESAILEEAKYDGYYAVVTNLNSNIERIININRRRWEIEESFRITKTELKARPVYLSIEERIKAHFLICFTSLLLLRLLEYKLNYSFSIGEIQRTLQTMNFLALKNDIGFQPAFNRTKLTDELHKSFNFYLDKECYTNSAIRKIISETKKD